MPTYRLVLSALLCVLFSFTPACEDTGTDFGEGSDGSGVVGQSSQGLKGAYFNNMDFTDQVLERVDAEADFEWGRGSPDSKVGSDSFSVRWTGFVKPKYSETYTFYTVGDDGIRLYVNDELVVSDWSNHGARERSGTISLEAGTFNAIKLEYYEDGGGAVAKLLWSSRSQSKEVVPREQLFTQLPSDSELDDDEVVDNCPNDPRKTEPGECGCGVPEGSCGGEVRNVALGKPTSQSTIAYQGESSRAVDGNTSGRYADKSVTHTDFEAAPWWRVDLGAAYQVQSVILFNRTDCCDTRLSNFHVDYVDGQGRVIATKDHTGAAGTQTEISLAASGVYAVRIQLRGTNALSLAEVQVFGAADAGGTSLCVEASENKTATLSCEGAEKITRIDFASYGLPTGSCDAGLEMGTCHASASQGQVEQACLGKSSCTVSASNGLFGDPCPGKYKRLAVLYTCGSGAVVEDQCPADPNKTAPGVCGCGTPDVDLDNNGILDCNETDCADTLAPDEHLGQGEFLCSPGGRYQFGLTSAGRLVFLDSGKTIWDAGFSGATFLAMQGGDGHLVAYRAEGAPLWGSGTASSANKDAVSLVVEDSGRAALLKDASTLLWWVDKDGEHDSSDIPTDLCPYDPSKTAPGVCGCNVPESACDGVTVDRARGSDLRVGVYNVLRSSIFPEDDGDPDGNAARIAGFKRVANAVDADIWAMQEVMYDGKDQPGRSPNGLKRYMEKITGGTWYMAHHPDYQEFVFSRYPIDASGTPGRRIVWALIDVGNDNNRSNDVLVVSVHFVTDGQGNEAAELVRDVKAGKYSQIPKDVTILVVGDFNNQPTGARYKAVQSAFGLPDLRPIWLGTPNTRFTHGGLTYSNGFRAPQNGNPIDYIFARTSDAYEIAKNFILSTLILDQSVLDAHGLERMDVAVNPAQSLSNGTNVSCDHFPLFVDLKPKS